MYMYTCSNKPAELPVSTRVKDLFLKIYVCCQHIFNAHHYSG